LLIALTILFNNHKQLAGNGVLTTLKGCYVQLIALAGIGKGAPQALVEESVPSIDASGRDLTVHWLTISGAEA